MDPIARERLAAQRVAAPLRGSARDVVAWMGAMQAQDYLGVRFALGVRLAGRHADAEIERSIARGDVVRIHALRFTWQLVTPGDVRSILAVTSPRMRAGISRRLGQLDLDERTLRRAGELLVERVLAGDEPVARDDVAAGLERAGISVSGQRLVYILMAAEIDGLVCNGARDGKRFTYTRLERLAPAARAPIDREEALARLAATYFTSRGPATVHDFAWWSGLPIGEARRGAEAAGDALAREGAHLRARRGVLATAKEGVFLLPPFDEMLIAYRDRSALLDPAHVKRINAGGGMLDAVMVVDGRVVGRYRRVLARDRVVVELEPFHALPKAARAAIEERAHAYGRFLEKAAEIRWTRADPRAPR